MALVVENGSAGNPLADSYVDADEASAFFTARGLGVPLEPLLLRAMDTLEGLEFAGRPTSTAQPLAWPRTGVIDVDGVAVASTIVPRALRRAQLWLAHYIQAGSDPGAVATPAIRSEKVDTLEVEYATGVTTKTGIDVRDLPLVYGELLPLLALSEKRDTGVRTIRTTRA